MKILILIFSIAFCFAQNEGFKLDRKGLGFEFHAVPQGMLMTNGVESTSSYGIYFPMEFGKYCVEPYFSRYYIKVSATMDNVSFTVEDKSTSLGIGLFLKKKSEDKKSRLYYGARFMKGYFVYEEPSAVTAGATILTESYPTMISPTLGAEYFIVDNFSFSGEVNYNMVSFEETIDDVKTTYKVDYLMPMFLVRMYF